MYDNLIIRAKTFRHWFLANFSAREIREIADHGVDCGGHVLTYAAYYVKVFDKFANEIWEMAVADSEEFGHKNVCEMLATFRQDALLNDWDTFRNLLVWYAAEKVALEICNC